LSSPVIDRRSLPPGCTCHKLKFPQNRTSMCTKKRIATITLFYLQRTKHSIPKQIIVLEKKIYHEIFDNIFCNVHKFGFAELIGALCKHVEHTVTCSNIVAAVRCPGVFNENSTSISGRAHYTTRVRRPTHT
jgi:hypothetical protein